MKNRISTILLLLMLFVGLSLLLYPTVSDYWNSFHQTQAIARYVETVAKISPEEYQRILQEAKDYNARLLTKPYRWEMSPQEEEEYNSILNISGNGVMGYIDIPEINVELPIYHGTDESTLQVAIGHLKGSSLPIGGLSTHSAVSGHRGLPSAKLFTNLDKLVEGDTFVIRVLNEVFTYEIDQIRIVLPNEISDLAISSNNDYCTLITCTPYGVNSHRLLVRGHRVENDKNNDIKIVADAMQIDPIIVSPIVAVPMLIILFVIMMATTGKKK